MTKAQQRIYTETLLQRIINVAESVKADLIEERNKGSKHTYDYHDTKAQGAAEVVTALLKFREWELKQ